MSIDKIILVIYNTPMRKKYLGFYCLSKTHICSPFIEVPAFTRKWKELGLTDENLRVLQQLLLDNPKAGTVIQGTGGIRKLRIPLENTGKRGGGRVFYVDIELKETIYFINVYTKNEKDDLTEDEKKAFKAIVTISKEE